MQTAPPRYPGRAPIEAYGNGGFRFAGMSHRGSLLCLGEAILGWTPTSAEGLTLDDFALLLAEPAGIELLLLGTGREFLMPSVALRAGLREAGIRIEPMDTGAACRTYNVLLAEGRPVGAALIAVE
ncbi:MAG: hypothetical protein J0I57_16070 [Hyphomicrobium sp.]|uniref:Mth938-like domain-containing protein n=1 Tax=Hyphomicrobium sp. CS1BSMeth3 TaxID=1892844 RepID=UPI00086D7F32|nr:MTH938/NDUFAF3 family protein [Hyphomicrobium sp. CS1BSMeth3]MBN9259638.1 hypothetical protein [Hyphomicrobium sp.]MBN9265286.1 hypothetical protein [Hyphomicrobium sp.]MBN9279128.1 hypothetical protein [Hyphomicrobium sp.]ODT30415.1 MAG: hypothetical protein ABS54_02620 [Hyphomicrobium sp. SCN 65-11]